jgi:hypothetical protein
MHFNNASFAAFSVTVAALVALFAVALRRQNRESES